MRWLDQIYWLKKEALSNQSPKDIYDDLADKGIYESSIKYGRRVKRLNKVFARMGREFSHILDLACGTGALIDALPWKATAEIVGLDVSKNMLAVAEKRFKTYQNIKFIKGDFMNLDFPPASFDLITNAYATRFIPAGREEEFVKSVANLLMPDGRFVAFGDGSVRWLGDLLGFLGIKPTSYNFKMNYHRSIVKQFEKYFRLEKLVVMNKIPMVYSNNALVFKKAQ